MSPDHRLPIRPTPAPGEAFTSYTVRLAALNGLIRTDLVSGPADIRVPHHAVQRVADLAGLPAAAVAELTLDIYPPSIAGRGRARRGSWTLPAHTPWTCPMCTPRTGIRRRDWRLALHPACTDCHLLLTPNPHHSTAPAPAPEPLLALIAELTGLAQAARTSAAARNRLARYGRLCALTAQTIDDTWPTRDPAIDGFDPAAARRWRTYPATDPATVAIILLATQPALTSRPAHQDLAAAGRRRLEQLTRPSTARPAERRNCSGFTAQDGQRLTWLTARLHRAVARYGLRPAHIPALLPQPGDSRAWPDPSTWGRRFDAAVAAHMLVTDLAGGYASPAGSCHTFGIAEADPCRLYDGIRYRHGITHLYADLISGAVDQLLTNGLIDYQRRRATLRTLTRLPRLPIPTRRLPDLDDIPGPTLGLAWLWLCLTHGPPFTSPQPAIPVQTIVRFDGAIDPEARLALYEAGLQVIADAEHATPVASAAVAASNRWRRRSSRGRRPGADAARGSWAGMRGISREVLARWAAGQVEQAACRGWGRTWTMYEAEYRVATTTAGRAAALSEPAVVCRSCPALTACADWATIDRYTGIAAGRAYRTGRPDTYRTPISRDQQSA